MDEVRSDFLSDINSFLTQSKSYLNSVLSNLNWSECHLYSNDNVVNSSMLNDVSDLETESSNSNKGAVVKDEIKIKDVLSDLIADFPPKVVKKDETLLDILARERDLKRRRVSYKGKIHTKHKSHYEILRGVIAQQMEILEDPILLQSASSDSKDETRTAHNDLEQLKMIDFSRMHVDNPHTAWKYAIRELKHKEKEREQSNDKTKFRNRSISRENHRNKYDKSKERDNYKKDKEFDCIRDKDKNNSISIKDNSSYRFKRKDSSDDHQKSYSNRSRNDHDKGLKKNLNRDNPADSESGNYNNRSSSIEKKLKKVHCPDKLPDYKNDNFNTKNIYHSKSSLKSFNDILPSSSQSKSSEEDKNIAGSHDDATYEFKKFSEVEQRDYHRRESLKSHRENISSVNKINSQKNVSRAYRDDKEPVRRRNKQDSFDDNYKSSDFYLRESIHTSNDKNMDENNRKLSISKHSEVDTSSDKFNSLYGTNKIYHERNEFISKNSSENIKKKVNYSIDKDVYNDDTLRKRNATKDIREESNVQIRYKNSDDRTVNTNNDSYSSINEDKMKAQFNRVSYKEYCREPHDELSNRDFLDIKNVKDTSSSICKSPQDLYERDEYHRRKTHNHQCKKRNESDEYRKRKKYVHHYNSLNVEPDVKSRNMFKDTDRLSSDSLSSENENSSNVKSSSSDKSSTDHYKKRKREKRHHKKSKKRKGDDDKHKKKKKRSRSKERKRKRK